MPEVLERNGSRIAEHFADPPTASPSDAPPDAPASLPSPLRLNLGSGPNVLPGFISVDRKLGSEIVPLAYPDESVDEILASHVLEHFSHRRVGNVLAHWYEKLKPGGRIRLSVPNFEYLAKSYMDGAPIDLNGYAMGGHSDKNDYHGCLFDRESLSELLAQVGFERISDFPGTDYKASCQLDISLNLQAFKPSSPIKELSGVRAVMSAPRFGPTLHYGCHNRAFIRLGLHCTVGQSCFWHQRLSEEMEGALKAGAKYVLTLDFDTVFQPSDVMELYRLMECFPDVDALFPIQSKRNCMDALFSLCNADGSRKITTTEADLERQVLPAATGHFGLTMFRAESLKKFPRPWMYPVPDKNGRWAGEHIDADIVFWQQFKDRGFKACLAPRVVVGHIEQTIMWPGKDLRPVFQTQDQYDEVGIPAEVAR